MKAFAIVFLFIFCSCSKNVSILKNDLNGTWVLKRITGGIAGIDTAPHENTTITFNTSGDYTSTINYAVTDKGFYSISKADDPSYGSEDVIKLNSNSGLKTVFGITINNDSLFLSEGCCDQFNYTYIKQK